MSQGATNCFFWFIRFSYYFLRLDQNSLPLRFTTAGRVGVERRCSFFSTLCTSIAIWILLLSERGFFSRDLKRKGRTLVTLLEDWVIGGFQVLGRIWDWRYFWLRMVSQSWLKTQWLLKPLSVRLMGWPEDYSFLAFSTTLMSMSPSLLAEAGVRKVSTFSLRVSSSTSGLESLPLDSSSSSPQRVLMWMVALISARTVAQLICLLFLKVSIWMASTKLAPSCLSSSVSKALSPLAALYPQKEVSRVMALRLVAMFIMYPLAVSLLKLEMPNLQFSQENLGLILPMIQENMRVSTSSQFLQAQMKEPSLRLWPCRSMKQSISQPQKVRLLTIFLRAVITGYRNWLDPLVHLRLASDPGMSQRELPQITPSMLAIGTSLKMYFFSRSTAPSPH